MNQLDEKVYARLRKRILSAVEKASGAVIVAEFNLIAGRDMAVVRLVLERMVRDGDLEKVHVHRNGFSCAAWRRSPTAAGLAAIYAPSLKTMPCGAGVRRVEERHPSHTGRRVVTFGGGSPLASIFNV